MAEIEQTRANRRQISRGRLWRLLAVGGLAIGVVLWLWSMRPDGGNSEILSGETLWGGKRFPLSQIAFTATTIGLAPGMTSQITNVRILDFDQDGRSDILVSDARYDEILLYRQSDAGLWNSEVLARIIDPASTTPVDLDGDGDLDVIVSVLGNVRPDDGIIGSVVLLENLGGRFEHHVLLSDVRRVTDTQPADFDGDGDLDLAVAVFGYSHGQLLWLENQGGNDFVEHELMSAPGAIHVPVSDFDGDGDIDFATVISQDEEEVWAFENLGGELRGANRFRKRRIWFTDNFDIGCAGLVLTDLDRDGDDDLLLPVGDNLEAIEGALPQPYHGCFWLENRGNWDFAAKRIASFGGTYAAAPGDFDGDQDTDVVLVSMDNEWSVPGNPSVVWLENQGEGVFQTWHVADRPIRLITVAAGDLDGDGRDDILAGGFRWFPPHDRLGNLTVWLNGGRSEASGAEPQTLTVDRSMPPRANLQHLDKVTAKDLQGIVDGFASELAAGEADTLSWRKLADTYQAYGFLKESLRCYTAADELDHEGDFKLHYHWAVCLSRLGDTKSSNDHFRRALELTKIEANQFRCWYNIGRNHLREEQGIQAENAFRQVLQHPFARCQLAKLLIRTGRAAEALPLVSFDDSNGPLPIQMLWLRARAEEALGLTDTAADSYELVERASVFDTFNIDIDLFDSILRDHGLGGYVTRCDQLLREGKLVEAQQLCAESKDGLSNEHHHWLEFSEVNTDVLLGDLESARRVILVRTERDGPDPMAMDLLSRTLEAMERPKEAAEALEQAIEMGPDSERYQRLAKLERLVAGRQNNVQNHLAESEYWAGVEAYSSNNLNGALTHLEKAVDLNPDHANAWYFYAQTARFLGRAKTAQEAFERCLGLDPCHGKAAHALARIAESRGK